MNEQQYLLETKLATESGLLLAGKELALREQRRVDREKNRSKVIEIINCYNFNDLVDPEPPLNWIKIIKAFNAYVEFSEEDLVNTIEKYTTLKEEYGDMVINSDNLLKELETLEKKYEQKEIYWANRVVNLRTKCLQRNRTILMLKIVVTLLTIFIVVNMFHKYISLRKDLGDEL